jgi:hypothetical protein
VQLFRQLGVRRACLGAAGAFLLALVACLAVRVAGAHKLSVARGRFEAEVGPLPRIAKRPAAAVPSEDRLVFRLGGPARLPDEADSTRIRQLLSRAPSTWSPAEVDDCRRFLAANASLQAASDRAAGLRGTPWLGARSAAPSDPADTGRLLTRAGAQTSLQKLRLRLALLQHSSAEMRRSMEALAAEVEAFETEPGVLSQLIGLSQEKGLLQAMAWVAEAPDVDREDLAVMRRLVPHRPLAATVRQLFASEAGYMLANVRPSLSDADVAQILDGYRRLCLTLEHGRSTVLAAGPRKPRAVANPDTVPAAILASVRANFESTVEQLAATIASSQLAELALDLRLAATRGCAYPQTLDSLPLAREPDPFTAQRPRFVRDPQDGAILSNPSAAAAWDALPHCGKTKPPPYVWRLPPPCSALAPSRSRGA